ncbi:MAG: hypothetical protein KAU03_05180 [Candidatus Altiarchaeales archaeon]|nr:hypothetical protein [Candidatus Altiarchaeales archaeon]
MWVEREGKPQDSQLFRIPATATNLGFESDLLSPLYTRPPLQQKPASRNSETALDAVGKTPEDTTQKRF